MTIKDQRRRIADYLSKNPNLKSLIPKSYEKIYGYAVTEAAKEIGIDESTFLAECPWVFDQAMDADFWPDA